MNHDTAKHAADWAAGGITLAVIVQWLPPVAAAVTIIYTLIRIWETQTARRLLRAVCERCAAWWEA
ncbi:MAG: hypothetical protein ACM30I_01885 [Gemmatimonas sp.]